MKTIVVALGGNALEDNLPSTSDNQLQIIRKAVVNIVDLIELGYKVIITHGNGPQVGRIVLQNEYAKEITPAMPLEVCGAMSQGMIGYHLQQALDFELLQRNIKKPVISLITQVVVDKNDLGFKNPTKPIGPFYNKEEKEKLEKEYNFTIKEDSNRGYRRVVASPRPKEIIELPSIKALIEKDKLVIACGGGGIPVVRKKDNSLQGIAAVIDKDLASAKLATDLQVDYLIILTAVPCVYINYGKSNQQALKNLTIKEAQKYIKEEQFAAGSMLPKIEAIIEFLKNNPKGIALITSLYKVKEALIHQTTGTFFKN